MRTYIKTLFAAFASLTVVSSLKAEVFSGTYSTTMCTNTETLSSILLGPGVRQVRNDEGLVSYTAEFQVGVYSNLFANALPSFFTNGVILSTGDIAQGPSTTNSQVACLWDTEDIDMVNPCLDEDLNAYFEERLPPDHAGFYDAAGIVLYIKPQNATINIPFVMASEHFYQQFDEPLEPDYPLLEDYESYSDKFVFFLQKEEDADRGLPMINNIARLPDGSDVEIATVNQHTNTEYFISNVVTNEDGYLDFSGKNYNLPMEFNGAIVGPVAVFRDVEPDTTYKLKILLADDWDNIWSSVVFLRAQGITSGANLAIKTTGPEPLSEPGPVTFTNIVSNIGEIAADGVVVTNYLPLGISTADVKVQTDNVGTVGNWFELNGTNCCVWTIGDNFAAGSNAMMRVACTNKLEIGSYTNIATVATSLGDYREEDNIATCEVKVGEVDNRVVLTIKGKKITKCYGEIISLADLDFIETITDDKGVTYDASEIATNIAVTFTNDNTQVESYPTNATTEVETKPHGIYLSNILLRDPSAFKGVTFEAGELVITQALLTISVTNVEWKVGQPRPANGYEPFADQLRGGDAPVGIVGNEVGYTNLVWQVETEPENINAGSYLDEIWIVPAGERAKNYAITVDPGDLTIVKKERPLDIYAIATNKVYGSELKLDALDFIDRIDGTNGTENISGIDVSFTNAQGEVVYPTNLVSAAGTYGIVISNVQGFATGAFTTINYHPGAVEVTKRPLKIVPNYLSKPYGDTYELFGDEFDIFEGDGRSSATLVGNDEILTVDLQSAGTADKVEQGRYDITATKVTEGVGYDNYEISFGTGTLSVAKFKITITANDVTNAYGETSKFVPGEGFSVTPTSRPVMPTGEQVTMVTLTNSLPTSTEAGKTYSDAIVPSHIVTGDGGFLTNNYDITFVRGALTVTNAQLTITANSTNRIYGTTLELHGTEFTLDPVTLPNRETVTKVLIESTQATNASARVGTYGDNIVPSQILTGTIMQDNYDITFKSGTLEVKPRPITVLAKDVTKTYGDALTLDKTAFVITNGTLAADEELTEVTMTYTKTEDEIKNVGEYKGVIHPDHDVKGSIVTNNYDITFSNGTLRVEPRPITILANDVTNTYGDALTLDRTAFVITNGTLAADEELTEVTMTYTKTEDEIKNVGEYKGVIHPDHDVKGSIVTNNYDITFSNGTLTVTKAPLTIIANDATNCYGEVLKFSGTEFTTQGELKYDDVITRVSLTNLMDRATEVSANPYPNAIEPSHIVTGEGGFHTNNYDITFVKGSLTVTQAVLKIVVNNSIWRVGKPKQEEAGYQSFADQLKVTDQQTDVLGYPETYSNATLKADYKPSSEDVNRVLKDEILILTKGGKAKNYLITIDPGDLTIKSAEVNLTVGLSGVMNSWTGCEDLTLTIKNEGDTIPQDYNYWVELMPQTNSNGEVTFCIFERMDENFDMIRTKQMPNGCDYMDLTEAVTNALKDVGDHNLKFNQGEEVTISNICFYYCTDDSARQKLEVLIGEDRMEGFVKSFFKAGKLFNPADTNHNFIVEGAEKHAPEMKALLGGETVFDYIEMTRLSLLPYYLWDAKEGTWVGPAE